MPSLPPEMIVVLAPFAQPFSDRVWRQAQVLVLGAILAPGKRMVSSCLRVMGLAWEGHFTNYHRVLNRAQWSTLQASKVLLGIVNLFALMQYQGEREAVSPPLSLRQPGLES